MQERERERQLYQLELNTLTDLKRLFQREGHVGYDI